LSDELFWAECRVSSVHFWHEADIEEARIGATPNVRFAATSLKGRLAAEGRPLPKRGWYP
jgi:hypothetical protein